MEKFFSVIMPNYNNGEWITKSLNSIFQQTFTDYEVIVIDDCSTDNSVEQIKNFNVKLIECKEKAYNGGARNIGLKNATGKYVSFIDNDDFISKDYLHQLYQTMRNTNCDWCVFPWFADNEPIALQIDINNPLATSWSIWSYCFNRRIIKDTKFNFRLNVGEDIEWIYKIITSNTKGTQIYTPLYYFTWDGNDNSLSYLYNNGKMAKENE